MKLHIKHCFLVIKFREVLQKFNVHVDVRDCFEYAYFNSTWDIPKDKIK